jgi:pyrroloquinoline-quinone synthase
MTPYSLIEQTVQSKTLLNHPFYLRWSKGELTMDELKIYALEYFSLAAAIPNIVQEILDRLPADQNHMTAFIEENMKEEQEHAELWKRFAYSLGVTEAELDAYVPSTKTQAAIQSLLDAAAKSFEDGVITMYAFECELSKIAQTKKEGLLAFYNLTSHDAHVYFDEHIKEEEHLKVWRQIPVSSDNISAKASVSIDAQHKVLDAVCDACGISMVC